jgi:hypothetical protein
LRRSKNQYCFAPLQLHCCGKQYEEDQLKELELFKSRSSATAAERVVTINNQPTL